MMARKYVPQPRRNPSQGFALLVTIVLVSFLVLILVGLATFTRVETQVAANSQQVAQARQNAVMALNLALGQLQKYAGPDKAVTARGDITSTSVLNQPYLTGVWSATNTTSTPDTWLVSGNEINPVAVSPTTAPNPGSATSAVDDVNNQVFLVSNGTVGSTNNTQRVLLLKQPITASSGSVPGVSGTPTTGHYAWWVGDEGIKASASLVDQNLTATPLSYNNSGSKPGDDWSSTTDKATIRKRNQLNQLSQPRPVLEKVITALKPDADDLASLPKVLALNQLATVPTLTATAGASEKVKAAFHDVTVLSRGVLADTSTGRLRTDFSPANTGIPALDSYIKLRPDVPPTASSPYVSEFYPQAPSWDGTGTPTWPIFVVTPVMTEAAIYFGFDIVGGNLRLKYWLKYELWNPYSATIRINPAHALSYSVTLPTEVKFKVNQTTPALSQTITLPAGKTFTGKTTTMDTTIGPGRCITLRGASTIGLATDGYAMEADLDTSAATLLTSINNIDVQSTLNGITYTLRLVTGNALLQNYTVTQGSPFSTVTGVPLMLQLAPCLAYGFTYHNNPEAWLTGHTNVGGFGAAFDPRLPTSTRPYLTSHTNTVLWYTDPSANYTSNNTTDFNSLGGAGSFAVPSTIRTAQYDLPRQELVSVAELRHLAGNYPLMVGNSWGGTANKLFDQAFFSTIPQNYNWAADGTEPRPNRYLDVYFPPVTAAATLTDLRDETKNSRYQLIRGAFNINSTSEAAWRAVLSAPSFNYDFASTSPATTSSVSATLSNPYFRLPAGAKEISFIVGTPATTIPMLTAEDLTSIGTNNNQKLTSAVGRQLNDTEISSLALQIISQLKTRKRPFLSLADFVNSDSNSGIDNTKGILENAINSAGLNNKISMTTQRYGNGAITQADVIAKIAPFMAARTDTFVIRSYGDVQNPVTEKVEGRAWCEATIQRLPDLVSDPAAEVAKVMAPDESANPFGRRFKIISFRWLSTNDL